MLWPQSVDYNAAIQFPPACFADEELARGQPAEGMIPGIPLSYAGNFATVYKIVSPTGQTWAVKCFTRKVENLQQRYRGISDHLQRCKRRFVVDFQYLAEGIKIDEAWYPALKMQWVDGFTLNEFLRERVHNRAILEQLCHLWLRLANDMREDDMAHGDLQHGNVMLVPASNATSMLLRLVDYDGMWVPALADLPPGEVGHANYQHPKRLADGGCSSDIDRFSHLVIFTALRCLMVGGRELWAAHDNEENLLFREADFKSPGRSQLFAKLLALPDADAAALAGHLLLASQGPLDQVPFITDLVSNDFVAPLSPDQIERLCAFVPQVPLTNPSAVSVSVAPPGPIDWFIPEEATFSEPTAAATRQTTLDMPTLTDIPALGDAEPATPDHRRAAVELYEHAREVIRAGDTNYALHLLLSCCKLYPASVEYRRALREVRQHLPREGGNGWLTALSNLSARNRLRSARLARDHKSVLQIGEDLLARLPGDVPVQIDMANAAEALGWHALAVWLLKEAREQAPNDLRVLRALALLCERLERPSAAAFIWQFISRADPDDLEALVKVKNLSADAAIARTATLV